MECGAYHLTDAVVFNNDNLKVDGKILYAPVYMIMFVQKKDIAPDFYKIDLSGLN